MKKLDGMGRLTIPKEMRASYNLNPNTEVQIIDNGNGLLVIPADTPYTISQSEMDTLRKLYLMLQDSGFLDEYFTEKLSKITKESESKCDTCGSKMFLTKDNTYKCYKCGDE